MELPKEVLVHNQQLGMKGSRGTLLQVAPEGYFVVNCAFGDKVHRVLLPIQGTVLIYGEPEESFGPVLEIER